MRALLRRLDRIMNDYFEVVVMGVCFGACLGIIIVLLNTGGTP